MSDEGHLLRTPIGLSARRSLGVALGGGRTARRRVREVVECRHRHLEHFPRAEDVSRYTKDAIKDLEELRDLESRVFALLKNGDLAED